MNRRIHLLIVTHTLDQGGLEEIVRLYAHLLDKKKFFVTIAYMVGGRISQELQRDENIRMVWIETKSRPARLLQLVRLARRLHIDILHNHLSWYGLLAGFFAGARRVETIHNTYTWLTGTKRLAFGFLSLLAHRLIAVSHVVKDFTHQYFPFIPETKLIVIHNGIDLDRLSLPTNADVLRMKLGFSTDDFLVTFAGRLEEQKGLAYLLEAAYRLQRRYANIKLVIVGEGSLEVQLRERAQTLGLPHVFFLGSKRCCGSACGVQRVRVALALRGAPFDASPGIGSRCSLCCFAGWRRS